MSVIAAFILSLVIVLLVFDMLRRKKIREKYAALWLVVGLSMLVLAAFPRLLEFVADILHVQVPSNLLFAMSIVLALGVCLHLSWEISVVEDETRVLAEEAAILRAHLDKLEQRIDVLTSHSSPTSQVNPSLPADSPRTEE
ncbi:MAG: DUF2304 domain-containing protein [Specibacter sp.]